MADDDLTRVIPPKKARNVFAVGDIVAGNYQILSHAGAVEWELCAGPGT
jgi:hypothetical protein